MKPNSASAANLSSVTHFGPLKREEPLQPRAFCGPNRPCYRPECVFCTQRRRSHFLHRISYISEFWSFQNHVVLTADRCPNSQAPESILGLSKNRERFSRYFGRHNIRYCSCLSFALGEDNDSCGTPHIHWLTETINSSVEMGLRHHASKLSCRLSISSIKNSGLPNSRLWNIKKIAAYIFDKNYVPTSLMAKPRGINLMSASRGLRVGRPRAFWNEFEAWGSTEGDRP